VSILTQTDQLQLGARTVKQLSTVFELLDPEDLDGSFPDWVDVVHSVVAANRTTSVSLAASYLTVLRTITIGGPSFAPILSGPVDLAALSTSMLVTGPISIRSNLTRMATARAVDIAKGRTAAAGMRHALNGGRDTIMQTVKADPRAGRWQRVTSGAACDFCSVLADRGAVYSEDSSDFESHDHCSCTAEPIYS
jgi:hypothetical protein